MAGVAVRDLLDSGVEGVGLADVELARSRERAKKLGDDRVEALEADAQNAEVLTKIMKGWDVVINSTWYEFNLGVMGAAIRAGIDYLDLGGLYHVTLKQLAFDKGARDAGVTCVVGLGSSPGVTNLMAIHGAQKMSKVSEVKIRVAGASPVSNLGGFKPPYSFRTILDEASMPAAVLTNGRIEMVPAMSHREEFGLPEPVGMVEGCYTLHSELATLPKNIGKGVQEMNFIVAFSPMFARGVSLLVTLGFASKEEVKLPGGGGVVPYDLITSVVSTPPPEEAKGDFGIRRVELFGEVRGESAHLVYDNMSGPHEGWGIGGRALGTGVPASLGAQWLARGMIKKKGVLPPEECLEAEPFLHELAEQERGIKTYLNDGRTSRQL
jgi:saccharopine dehydrogenase-like NADP-dependent oxidoreductase